MANPSSPGTPPEPTRATCAAPNVGWTDSPCTAPAKDGTAYCRRHQKMFGVTPAPLAPSSAPAGVGHTDLMISPEAIAALDLPDTTPVTCPRCGGTGHDELPPLGRGTAYDCSLCDHTGSVPQDRATRYRESRDVVPPPAAPTGAAAPTREPTESFVRRMLREVFGQHPSDETVAQVARRVEATLPAASHAGRAPTPYGECSGCHSPRVAADAEASTTHCLACLAGYDAQHAAGRAPARAGTTGPPLTRAEMEAELESLRAEVSRLSARPAEGTTTEQAVAALPRYALYDKAMEPDTDGKWINRDDALAVLRGEEP